MLDTDLWWTQIYVGHRYKLDNRSKVVNWSKLVDFFDDFRTFSKWSQECSQDIFIKRKVLPRGSGGVLSDFFRFVSEVFGKVPRSFSGTPGWFLGTFGKNGSGVGRGSGGSGGLPNEDSYIMGWRHGRSR